MPPFLKTRQASVALLVCCGCAAPSADETLIRAERARFNQTIAAHDTATVGGFYVPEYVLVSSTNAETFGRDSARARFAQIFRLRPDVVYVREPTSIEVNADWGQAAESGRWVGHWTQADGVTELRGSYFAKWRKVGDRWMLLAEVFVQTSCTGSSYCRTPP